MKIQKSNNFEFIGIGTDIVKVNRFREKTFNENKSFYDQIFSNEEIEYCLNFKDPYIHFAGKFAIKESVIKALSEKISFKDISLRSSDEILDTLFKPGALVTVSPLRNPETLIFVAS